METVSELIDKLSVVNIKLYMTKEKQSSITDDTPKDVLKGLIQQDLALCRERSALKKQIDAALLQALKTGSVTVINEVKQY